MEKEIKKLTLSRILAYVFGGLFLISGITSLFTSFLTGIVLILTSIILFPPLYSILESKTKIQLSKALRIVIVLVLLGVAGSLFSNDAPKTVLEKTNNEDSTEEITESKDEYVEIKTFEGKGNQNTESFNVTGKKVKITATTTGGTSGIGTFSGIELEKEEGGYIGPGLSISTEGTEDGFGETTYRNLKPGQYYIQVISGVDWEVKVEQSN